MLRKIGTPKKSKAGKPYLRVAILGGGGGGVGTALELAREGFQVDLYEKNSELLLGTSNQTPGRAGQGYHYVHAKTAELYLRATLEVVKRYPDCMLGFNEPETHYLRHGLYCIMKQADQLVEENQDTKFASIYPKEKILENYHHIQECYRKLVEEDPTNQVWGHPDNFYRVLTSQEAQNYKDTINLKIVDTIVDTREELLNWPKMRLRLIDEVMHHPNISLHLNSNVDNPTKRTQGLGGYCFTVNGAPKEADIIINSTWEGIEALNQKLGIEMQADSRTNRLKVIATMQLPEDIQQHPSVFFCMGPHAMISNMGNGKIMSTYAPITNVTSSTTLEVCTMMQEYLRNPGGVESQMKKADPIRAGVAQYFPRIKDAEILNVNYGIIKTRGAVDLFDPNSDVNKREEIGVEEQLLGWIDNACMKLLHFVLNAQEVVILVRQTQYIYDIVRKVTEFLQKTPADASLSKKADIADSHKIASNSPSLLQNILLQQYFLTSLIFPPNAKGKIPNQDEERKIADSLFTTLYIKNKIIKQLISTPKPNKQVGFDVRSRNKRRQTLRLQEAAEKYLLEQRQVQGLPKLAEEGLEESLSTIAEEEIRLKAKFWANKLKSPVAQNHLTRFTFNHSLKIPPPFKLSVENVRERDTTSFFTSKRRSPSSQSKEGSPTHLAVKGLEDHSERMKRARENKQRSASLT